MNWRRTVALALLFGVSASSAEVLWTHASVIDDSGHAQAVAVDGQVLITLADASEQSDTDDCACLCACGCTGAQTVVLPALPIPEPAPADASSVRSLMEKTPASPRAEPHVRPPLS